jgi:hypothetical protein
VARVKQPRKIVKRHAGRPVTGDEFVKYKRKKSINAIIKKRHSRRGRIKKNLMISEVYIPDMTFVKVVNRLADYKFIAMVRQTIELQDDKKQDDQAAAEKVWFVKPFQLDQIWIARSKLTMPSLPIRVGYFPSLFF